MDDIETSHEIPDDFLKSGTKNMLVKNLCNSQNFSPRLTRSKKHIDGNSCLELQATSNKHKTDTYSTSRRKVLAKNLETIYETPICRKGCTMMLGTSKIKRSLSLDSEIKKSKVKSKLRKIKIKKLGKAIKLVKMTDEEFKKKMLKLDEFINETDTEHDCRNENCYRNSEMEECNNVIENLAMVTLDMEISMKS